MFSDRSPGVGKIISNGAPVELLYYGPTKRSRCAARVRWPSGKKTWMDGNLVEVVTGYVGGRPSWSRVVQKKSEEKENVRQEAEQHGLRLHELTRSQCKSCGAKRLRYWLEVDGLPVTRPMCKPCLEVKAEQVFEELLKPEAAITG